MGSSWSARKESRRCILCFSPRELMGITPGSTMTTTPTMRWCSSRTTLVTSGTRSKASCSEPLSSATTTSRLVHVNTALRSEKWEKFRFLLLFATRINNATLSAHLLLLTSLRCCGGRGTRTSRCRWGDNAAPSTPAFHPGIPPQTRHHGDLWWGQNYLIIYSSNNIKCLVLKIWLQLCNL